MARLCCSGWHRSLWSADAADWNGPVWTGTSPASSSIVPSVPSPWKAGQPTDSREKHCSNWQNRTRTPGSRTGTGCCFILYSPDIDSGVFRSFFCRIRWLLQDSRRCKPYSGYNFHPSGAYRFPDKYCSEYRILRTFRRKCSYLLHKNPLLSQISCRKHHGFFRFLPYL